MQRLIAAGVLAAALGLTATAKAATTLPISGSIDNFSAPKRLRQQLRSEFSLQRQRHL